MSQTIKNKVNGCFLVYGDVMPLTSVPVKDSARYTRDAAPKRPTMNADTRKKLGRVLDILERQLKDSPDQRTPQESLEDAIRSITEQYEREARRQGINPAPEAPSRDYAAMNPHRRSSGIVCSEKPHIRKDGRFVYEDPEDRVTVPASAFEKRCADAEAAYASRNPHKAKSKKSAAMVHDSARRRMGICEQCEAAYAARNPHKAAR